MVSFRTFIYFLLKKTIFIKYQQRKEQKGLRHALLQDVATFNEQIEKNPFACSYTSINDTTQTILEDTSVFIKVCLLCCAVELKSFAGFCGMSGKHQDAHQRLSPERQYDALRLTRGKKIHWSTLPRGRGECESCRHPLKQLEEINGTTGGTGGMVHVEKMGSSGRLERSDRIKLGCHPRKACIVSVLIDWYDVFACRCSACLRLASAPPSLNAAHICDMNRFQFFGLCRRR